MKKYAIIFLILLWQINADAQKCEDIFRAEEYMPLKRYPEFKRVRKIMYPYLWTWVYGQYSAYLEFPKDVEKAFSFQERDDDLYPLEWRLCLWENRKSFRFETTDSTMSVYYKSNLFSKYTLKLDCDEISNDHYFRTYFCAYDAAGSLIDCCDSLYHGFWKMFCDSTVAFRKDTCLQALFPSIEDSTRFDYFSAPIRILYQYDSIGLQIHRICRDCYEMERNEYTNTLEYIAKEFCKNNGYAKIVFAAYFVIRKNTPECDCGTLPNASDSASSSRARRLKAGK